MKDLFFLTKVADLGDPDIVENIVSELAMCVDIWISVWMEEGSLEALPDADVEEARRFTSVLGALACMAKCVRAAERDKPGATEVRHALRIIMDYKKIGGAAGELAKAVEAYKSLTAISEASREYSAQGLEDQASTSIFDTSAKRFESAFEEAFNDLDSWAKMSGEPTAIAGRVQELSEIKRLLVALHNSLNRWSSTSLQEQLGGVGDCISNALLILSASSWSVASAFATRISSALSAILGAEQAAARRMGGVGIVKMAPFFGFG